MLQDQIDEDKRIIQLNSKSVSELIKQLEEQTAAQQKAEEKEFASLKEANAVENDSLEAIRKDIEKENAIIKETDSL